MPPRTPRRGSGSPFLLQWPGGKGGRTACSDPRGITGRRDGHVVDRCRRTGTFLNFSPPAAFVAVGHPDTRKPTPGGGPLAMRGVAQRGVWRGRRGTPPRGGRSVV